MFQYGILSDILKDGEVIIKDAFVCAEGENPKWFRYTYMDNNSDSCSGWYHEQDGYTYRPVDVEVLRNGKRNDGGPFKVIGQDEKGFILVDLDGVPDCWKKNCNDNQYSYRRIDEKKVEVNITYKVNGKERPLSELSDETLLKAKRS